MVYPKYSRSSELPPIIPMGSDIETRLTIKRKRNLPITDIISALLCDVSEDDVRIREYDDHTLIPVLNPRKHEIIEPIPSDIKLDADSIDLA